MTVIDGTGLFIRDWSTPLSGFVCGTAYDWFSEIDPDSACLHCRSTTTPLVRYSPGPYDLDHPPQIGLVCCRDCGAIQELEPANGQLTLDIRPPTPSRNEGSRLMFATDRKRPPRWSASAACLERLPGAAPCDSCTVRARCTQDHARQVSGPLADRFLAEVA